MARIINWVALAAGIMLLLMVVVSIFYPWWQLTIGQDLIKVNASPIYTNFGVFGDQFTIPIILVINIITILTFLACGAVMLIYSIVPTKPYAKQLLGFSYRKPLYSVVIFAVVLVGVVLAANHFGVNVPLNGSSTVTVPASWMMGVSISAPISASFEFSFYIAVVAAALCLAARLYHSHFTKPSTTPETAPPTPSTATISVPA